MLVLALTAAAVASAAAAWMVDRRRCRQRNRLGECGACGTSWAETASGDPYLIHGRLVCEDCAEKAKRRMPWQIVALSGFSALATGSALAGKGVAVVAFFSAGSIFVMTLGAVQLMKLANRSAQRRIAAGEFPDFGTLGTETNTDAKTALPEGLSGNPDR
jgi:Flp pilus assembly protein TadB